MISYAKTPLGWIEAAFSGDFLLTINFKEPASKEISPPAASPARKLQQQLLEYFEGNRTRFELPLAPEGTAFQKKVWRQLENIPFGHTITYGKLARQLDDPNKMRAVGRANGQNPIPIIIPCHRVIGSNGNLTGYSGGIERKKWLLKHEGALLL